VESDYFLEQLENIRLAKTTEIVYFEYSVETIGTVGEALACELAFFIATQTVGLIRTENGSWLTPDRDGNWVDLFSE
jgi:hypothetical protein